MHLWYYFDSEQDLPADTSKLENKCKDLEARSLRNNIRIVGVPEEVANNSTMAVATLLKKDLYLDKEPLWDRYHRTLQPKPKAGELPHAIVARLHYHSNCIDILHRARERWKNNIMDMTIPIFPDHRVKKAQARAAFNKVRRQLRGIKGTRCGSIHPAHLLISYGGEEKVLLSPDEAQSFINKLNTWGHAGKDQNRLHCIELVPHAVYILCSI